MVKSIVEVLDTIKSIQTFHLELQKIRVQTLEIRAVLVTSDSVSSTVFIFQNYLQSKPFCSV